MARHSRVPRGLGDAATKDEPAGFEGVPDAYADHTVKFALGLPPRSPHPAAWGPPSALCLSLGSTGLTGSGWYLVVRGLLQHLRAQICAELELPAPKIAPGEEQRLHLRAHGGRRRPTKDQGPGQVGGVGSGRRPALPGNAAARALPEGCPRRA